MMLKKRIFLFTYNTVALYFAYVIRISHNFFLCSISAMCPPPSILLCLLSSETVWVASMACIKCGVKGVKSKYVVNCPKSYCHILVLMRTFL